MSDEYVSKEVFSAEVRRLGREDEYTASRLEAKMEAGFARIEFRQDIYNAETSRRIDRLDEKTDLLAVQVQDLSGDVKSLYGEVKGIRGEISGMKQSIEDLKHFMTWGLALIGVMTVIAPLIVQMLNR